MNESYNRETIDSKLDSIHEAVKRVEGLATKTNGRVTALERWRWILTGAMIVLGAMSVPSLSVVVKAVGGI